MSVEVRRHEVVTHDDVQEHSLCLQHEGHEVPLVLWRHKSVAPPALVLAGHGGSGHKRSDRVIAHAHWFVRTAGIAVVAIDGPYHGDRVSQPLTSREYLTRIAVEGAARVVDRMTGDWLTAIEAVGESGLAGLDAVGYLGVSMGSRYGIPLAAALGDRCQAAVFGKFGLVEKLPVAADPDLTDLIRRAAAKITARTLFHVPWHDEVFPRDGQLSLFDLLGSPDKRLIAFPGSHAETHPDALAAWRHSLLRALT